MAKVTQITLSAALHLSMEQVAEAKKALCQHYCGQDTIPYGAVDPPGLKDAEKTLNLIRPIYIDIEIDENGRFTVLDLRKGEAASE